MTDNKNKPQPKSPWYKAERSSQEWDEYRKEKDPDKRADLDREYKQREDSECQEPGCKKEAIHHDKRQNKSGKCIEHWEGESDDNG